MKYLYGTLLVALFSVSGTSAPSGSDKYDIDKIYSVVVPNDGTKVINSYGNVEDVQAILVPTTLNNGTYEVTVTRKASDLYKIDGKDIYIGTKYCYKHVYTQKAILIIKSSYGYSSNEIVFIK